MLDLHQVVIVR